MFLRSAFKFHTRLLDTVHNKVLNMRFVAIVCLRYHLQHRVYDMTTRKVPAYRRET